jgi:hypothetical protein
MEVISVNYFCSYKFRIKVRISLKVGSECGQQLERDEVQCSASKKYEAFDQELFHILN